MHYLFLIGITIFGYFVVAPVWSQSVNWGRVTENENEVHFIDRASLQERGDEIVFWQLKNYKTPTRNTAVNKETRSVVMRMSANCLRESMTLLSYVEYEGFMAQGNIADSHTMTNPKPIEYVPGSIGTQVIASVCRR